MCVCVVVVYLSEFSDCTIIICRNTIYRDDNDCRSSKVPYIEQFNSLLLNFPALQGIFLGFALSLVFFTSTSILTINMEKTSWTSSPLACRRPRLFWFLAPRANPPACQVALCRSTTSCFVSVLIFKFWSPNFLCDSFRFWTSFLVNKF